MDTSNQKHSKSFEKPSKTWLLKRLATVASLRSTTPPEELAAYASSLSGFSQQAVEQVCTAVEQTVAAQFAPKFPPLGEMIEACRRIEQQLRNPKETEWTLDRYRLMVWFDKWMNEQVEDGATREAILALRPDMAPAWTRWKNQHLNRTIQIPARWCDKCEGNGVWVRREQSGAQTVLPCECKRRAA